MVRELGRTKDSGRAGDLAAEDGVLVPEHEQLCILGGVAAQQYRWDGQQSSGSDGTSAAQPPDIDHNGFIVACPDQERRLFELHRIL